MKPRTPNGGRTVSSTNSVETSGETCKTMKLDPYLTSFTKINLRWIKNLNETGYYKTRRKQKNLINSGIGNDFLYMIPKYKP